MYGYCSYHHVVQWGSKKRFTWQWAKFGFCIVLVQFIANGTEILLTLLYLKCLDKKYVINYRIL